MIEYVKSPTPPDNDDPPLVLASARPSYINSPVKLESRKEQLEK